MSHKFFKDAWYLFVMELFVRGKALIALPLLTQYLGTNAYGAWSQVTVVVATIIPLAVLGTDSAAMRYLPGVKVVEKARYFTAWMLLLCLTGLVGVGALLLFHGRVADLFFEDRPDAFLLVLLSGAMLCLLMLLNGLKNWFRVNDAARSWGAAAGLQAGLSLVGITAAIFAELGLIGVLICSLLADLVSVICLSFLVYRKQGWSSPDFAILPVLIRFGLPLIPTGFAMWGLNYLDRVVLARFGTLSDIGVYAVAYTLGCMLVQMLMSPIWGMYAPTVAALHNDGLKDNVQKLFNHAAGSTLVIVLPVVAGLAVLGQPIISLVAGRAFEAGAEVMWLVALGYVFSMMASYCETSLSLAFRQHYLTIAMTLAFAVNLLLNLWLVPEYSIFGAAVATLGAFFVQFLFAAVAAYKIGLLAFSQHFVFRVILAAISMAFVVSMFNRFVEGYGIVGLAANCGVGVLTYLIIIKALKLVPAEMERQIWLALRSKIAFK